MPYPDNMKFGSAAPAGSPYYEPYSEEETKARQDEEALLAWHAKLAEITKEGHALLNGGLNFASHMDCLADFVRTLDGLTESELQDDIDFLQGKMS